MNRYNNCNSFLFIITAVILYILFTPNKIYTDEYHLGGYIGLFADEQLDGCCVEIAPNTTFDMWVIIYPFGEGALGVGFSVQYCDNVVQVEEEYSPLFLEGTIGNLDDGFGAIFEECQFGDWVWVARQTLYMTDDQECEIRVRGFPPLSLADVLACNDNDYWLKEYSMLFINVPCGPISTESSSWGTIKSLFR